MAHGTVLMKPSIRGVSADEAHPKPFLARDDSFTCEYLYKMIQ